MTLGSALLLVLQLELVRSADFGKLSVRGLPFGLHCVNDEWQRKFIHVNGTRLTLTGGGGLQLATTPTAGGDEPSGYYQWKLLGNTLSYTVDLSAVACSCNAALYLVSMPGFNASSSPSTPDPRSNFYCGANAGKPSTNTSNPVPASRGNYCPEMDLLEANKFALQSTPHICNGTNRGPGFYPMCDWHGCATAVFNQSKLALCPGGECVIDTRRPFRHSISFPVTATSGGALATASKREAGSGGTLTAIHNVLEQEGRTFRFSSCQSANAQWTGGNSAEYLATMSANLRPGMVMDISLWGVSNKGMSWLDGPTGCKGDCNVTKQRVTFSDVALEVI
jgi:hypothetical protein